MKLLGIAGRKYAGKDSFAKPLLIENGGTFKQIRFADPLKDMLRTMFRAAGVDAATIERKIDGDLKETACEVLLGKTPRYAMQVLGTEWRNMIGENLWLNIAEQRIRTMARGGTDGVVITDARFPHEVALIKDLGGTVVRVVGGKSEINALSDHPSETQIDTLPVDMEVFNFGTLDALNAISATIGNGLGGSNV